MYDAKVLKEEENGGMRCWWFQGAPFPAWKPLQVNNGSSAGCSVPEARALHGLSYDRDLGLVVLFGGRGEMEEPLNDCWTFEVVLVSTPRSVSVTLTLFRSGGVDGWRVVLEALSRASRAGWRSCRTIRAFNCDPSILSRCGEFK